MHPLHKFTCIHKHAISDNFPSCKFSGRMESWARQQGCFTERAVGALLDGRGPCSGPTLHPPRRYLYKYTPT